MDVHWKNPPSFHDDSTTSESVDTWKVPPLTEDHATSADNPKVLPSNHDNSVEDEMKKIPTYTPYLQLPHLLSLAWITYPVISLIIVAFRLKLSLASAENGLDSVKSHLLSSCTAAEKSATAAASLPRYMAETSNRQFVDAANGVLHAAKSALILSLTAVEALINFVLEIFRTTLLCLLELAMSIGFTLVTDAVQVLNSTISIIGNDLANEIDKTNKVVTDAINTLNKNPFHHIPVPTISGSTELNSLRNLALPPSFQATLTSLNSSMPSADQIKDSIEDLVDTPFELLKKVINNTFDNLTFDISVFPIPDENRLTFCNNLDTSSIDTFKKDLSNIAKYGTYIIIGLIFIITGLNCLLIWYQWRSMKGHLERTRQVWAADPSLNPNGYSTSSPSAPQVNPSNGNLMMSQPAFPSAPEGNLTDRNIMMSRTDFPSPPQGTPSNGNIMMPQPAFSSASQGIGNLSDNNLTMSQSSAQQGNLSDYNIVMPQASASQYNVSDHKSRMSQAFAPQSYVVERNSMMPQASEPQGNLSDHNLVMPQASASQDNVSDHNLRVSQALAPQSYIIDRNSMMPQASAPPGYLTDHNFVIPQASASQGNVSDHNLTMPQASAPQSNVNDRNSTMPHLPTPQGNLSDRKFISQASVPQGNFTMSMMPHPPTPQGNLSDRKFMSQASVPQGNFTMSQASSPQGNFITSQAPAPQGNFIMSQAPAPQGNFMTSQPVSSSAPQMTLSDHNLMILQADSEHPLITRIMYILSARVGLTPSQNIDMRWFFHYIFHPPALACFLIGFFGLLSVMIQLLLLGPLLAAARAGVEIAVADISNTIVNMINKTMYEQSATYANDVNSKADVVQNAINHGLFGWVNGTTNTLNNSINHFYGEVQTFVTHIFNGTILETPASNFLQCVIGNKVVGIGKALTFLQDNLVIDIPRVSQDVLILSPRAVNEATGPIASGAVGSGSDGDGGLLGDAVAVYQDSLRAEAWLFGIFMGLWGVVLATAICVLLWRVHKRKKELAAANLQSGKTEIQAGLKHMKENKFSFPNDEKRDPQMGLEHATANNFSFPNDEKRDPQVGLERATETDSDFSFPNDEKRHPQVGLERGTETDFSFPNDEKRHPQVELKHVKENKISFPNDEKKDPFMDPFSD